MNGREIEAYLQAIYDRYDQSVKDKYEEWRLTNPGINFDTWAELFHPRWYEQFTYRKENARSN